MRSGFMSDIADIQWLNETHLSGVTLPSAWKDFASFVLQGNEDAPHAVNLYLSADPLMVDDFYRVRFVNDSGAYAEACEYDGRTNNPKGGLSPLV